MTPEKIFELNQATLNQEASLSDNHHRLNLKETIRSLDRSLEQLAEKIPHAILKALSKLPDHLNLNQLYKYSPYLVLALLAAYSLTPNVNSNTLSPPGNEVPAGQFEPTQIYPELALSSYQPPPPPPPPALSLEKGSVGLNIEFNEPGWSKYLYNPRANAPVNMAATAYFIKEFCLRIATTFPFSGCTFFITSLASPSK